MVAEEPTEFQITVPISLPNQSFNGFVYGFPLHIARRWSWRRLRFEPWWRRLYLVVDKQHRFVDKRYHWEKAV